MARIRTVKPEFWQDEDLATVSVEANLLAIGLLNHADDEGYFRANPALVKSVVFPLRETSVNVEKLLTELSNIDYISLHKGSDGKMYGFVVGFSKHQHVNRPIDSKFKGLIDLNERSVSHQTQLNESSRQERKGKEGKGRERKGKESNVKFIFDHWKSVMGHPQAKLDDKRKRIIQKALAQGYDPGQLKNAIDGCNATPWNMGDNPNSTVYDSLDLIFRDADHVDRFIKNFHSPPSAQTNKRLTNNQAAAEAAGAYIS